MVGEFLLVLGAALLSAVTDVLKARRQVFAVSI